MEASHHRGWKSPSFLLRRLHTNCCPAPFPLCPLVGRPPVKKPPASQQRGTPVCEAKSRSPCSAQSQQCFPAGLKFNPARCSKGLEVQLMAPLCGAEWSCENPSPEVSCRNKADYVIQEKFRICNRKLIPLLCGKKKMNTVL